MPQFDPANFLPQLVWLALVFVVLYFGVIRLTLPKLGRVMTGRETRMADDVAAAVAAKASADAAAAAYDAGLASARAEAKAGVAAAQLQSAEDVAARLKALDGELGARITTATAQIASARDAALADLGKVAAAMADDIIVKLLGQPLGATTPAAKLKRAAKKAEPA